MVKNTIGRVTPENGKSQPPLGGSAISATSSSKGHLACVTVVIRTDRMAVSASLSLYRAETRETAWPIGGQIDDAIDGSA